MVERATAAADEKRLSDWLRIAAFFGGSLGFLVYAITRAGYEAFFGAFNVSLEDVGLSEATLVAKAGVGLAFLLFVIALVAALLYLIEFILKLAWIGVKRLSKFVWTFVLRQVSRFRPPPRREKYRRTKKKETEEGVRTREEIVAAPIAAAVAALLIRRFVGSAILRFEAGQLVVALQREGWYLYFALLFIDVGIVAVSQLWNRRFPRSIDAWTGFWVWLLVASVLTAGFLTYRTVVNEGRHDAECAMNKMQTQSPLLDLRTELVRVHAKQGLPSGFSDKDRFLFLGADRMLVLFDLDSKPQRSLRITPDGVVLTGLHTPSCD